MKIFPQTLFRTLDEGFPKTSKLSEATPDNINSKFSVKLDQYADSIARKASNGSTVKRRSIWENNPVENSVLGVLLKIGGSLTGCSSPEDEIINTDIDGGDEGEVPEDLDLCDEAPEKFSPSDQPWSFKVSFYMEKGVYDLAISQNIDHGEFVNKLISGLNSAFNNGQHDARYIFLNVGILALDYNYPPQGSVDYNGLISKEESPLDEDVVVVLSLHPSQPYFDRKSTIRLNNPSLFENYDATEKTLIHEMGHFRGAIDLYNHSIGGLSKYKNNVYPGDIYIGNSKGIMGSFESLDWEDISRELIKEAARNPERTVACDSKWINSWEPEQITLHVVNEAGASLKAKNLKLYRRYNEDNLSKSDEWFSVMPDNEGKVKLPQGLLSPEYQGVFFTNFLISVEHNNQTFLNWLNIEDIVVPFRAGVSNLEIPIVLSDETKYSPLLSDLEVAEVVSPPMTVSVGESIPRKITIANKGPENFSGLVAVQFYISKDTSPSNYEDTPFGGATSEVEVPSQESLELNFGDLALPGLPPGAYYLIAKINSQGEFSYDPESSNNLKATMATFQVQNP